MKASEKESNSGKDYGLISLKSRVVSAKRWRMRASWPWAVAGPIAPRVAPPWIGSDQAVGPVWWPPALFVL